MKRLKFYFQATQAKPSVLAVTRVESPSLSSHEPTHPPLILKGATMTSSSRSLKIHPVLSFEIFQAHASWELLQQQVRQRFILPVVMSGVEPEHTTRFLVPAAVAGEWVRLNGHRSESVLLSSLKLNPEVLPSAETRGFVPFLQPVKPGETQLFILPQPMFEEFSGVKFIRQAPEENHPWLKAGVSPSTSSAIKAPQKAFRRAGFSVLVNGPRKSAQKSAQGDNKRSPGSISNVARPIATTKKTTISIVQPQGQLTMAPRITYQTYLHYKAQDWQEAFANNQIIPIGIKQKGRAGRPLAGYFVPLPSLTEWPDAQAAIMMDRDETRALACLSDDSFPQSQNCYKIKPARGVDYVLISSAAFESCRRQIKADMTVSDITETFGSAADIPDEIETSNSASDAAPANQDAPKEDEEQEIKQDSGAGLFRQHILPSITFDMFLKRATVDALRAQMNGGEILPVKMTANDPEGPALFLVPEDQCRKWLRENDLNAKPVLLSRLKNAHDFENICAVNHVRILNFHNLVVFPLAIFEKFSCLSGAEIFNAPQTDVHNEQSAHAEEVQNIVLGAPGAIEDVSEPAETLVLVSVAQQVAESGQTAINVTASIKYSEFFQIRRGEWINNYHEGRIIPVEMKKTVIGVGGIGGYCVPESDAYTLWLKQNTRITKLSIPDAKTMACLADRKFPQSLKCYDFPITEDGRYLFMSARLFAKFRDEVGLEAASKPDFNQQFVDASAIRQSHDTLDTSISEKFDTPAGMEGYLSGLVEQGIIACPVIGGKQLAIMEMSVLQKIWEAATSGADRSSKPINHAQPNGKANGAVPGREYN